MAYDGAIIFNTKIDNSGVQKDLDKLKREIQHTQESITKTETDRLPLLKQAEELKKKLQEARAELSYIKDEQSAAQSAIGGTSLEDHMIAIDRLPELNAAAETQKAKVDALEKEWSQVNTKIDQYNQKISQGQNLLGSQKAKAAEMSKQMSKGSINFSGAMEKAQGSAAKFSKRIKGIISQVFVFTLISKALQEITKYMGKTLKSNKQFTAELAKLKGALLTAFQPIYEVLVPALLSLMRVATNVVTAVARVTSLLGGKSMSEYAKSAKALNEEANAIEKTGDAAKKAQKSLAGFDQINTLSAPRTDTADVVPDFSGFDTSEVKDSVDELAVFLSGALLVIGIILAFTGVNIPLGIGLIAAGAIGLGTEAATNWDGLMQIIKENSALIAGISTVLLVIGIILALTGVALPLGIALIAVGAVGLVSTIALNWNTIKNVLVDALATLLAVVSGGFMVVGFLLCLSGAGIGLGLAMIAAGVAGSVAAWSLSDNPITRFVKNIANGVIKIVNMIIDAVNSLFHIRFDGLRIGNVQLIPKIDTKLLNIPKIPMLAQGAVIPPNREFMAVLGDQKHGTNIEAPLATIQEAVASVMADFQAGNMAGHEATVSVLREILEAVLGIEIGDSIIGEAVERYTHRMATSRGGV